MSKFRNRNMLLLFWCDNEKHMAAYEKLTKNYDYVSILHDRDIYTQADELKEPKNKAGSYKKAHIHAFVSFKNAKWSTALSEDIGLELHYFEEPQNTKNSLLYLLHYNDPDKAQYQFEDLKGPLKSRVGTVLSNMSQSECEKVNDLIDFIQSCDGKVSVTDFARFCALNGYWAEFRRSGAIFFRIIEEHNNKIQKKD